VQKVQVCSSVLFTKREIYTKNILLKNSLLQVVQGFQSLSATIVSENSYES